jgi:hypothetical protein
VDIGAVTSALPPYLRQELVCLANVDRPWECVVNSQAGHERKQEQEWVDASVVLFFQELQFWDCRT